MLAISIQRVILDSRTTALDVSVYSMLFLFPDPEYFLSEPITNKILHRKYYLSQTLLCHWLGRMEGH